LAPVQPQRPVRNHAAFFAVAGPQQGAVFSLHKSESIIGRAGSSDFSLGDRAISSEHLLVRLERDCVSVNDLASRYGTYLNGERIEGRTCLLDGDHVRIGDTVLKFAMLDELEEGALTTLFHLTVRDPLTGTYNRRYLEAHLESEIAFAEREETPLALLLIDIDHFKRVNDTHGHPIGDVVLKLVAVSIQRVLRTYDTLCRFGGEEFVVVARDTSQRNAELLAERLRRRIAALQVEVQQELVPITVSVGAVAADPKLGPITPETLLQVADQVLYQAKRAGRNRVVTSLLPTAHPARAPRATRSTLPPSADSTSGPELEATQPALRAPRLPRL
jgi:diguanylate cyclase (GGDEF)-like protein